MLARELLAARRRDVEVAEARYRIATATEADLLGARIEAARQEAAVHDAEAKAANALEMLRVLCGLPADERFRLRDDLGDVFEPSDLEVEGLVGRSARHPEVLRAQAELAAASRNAWTQRAGYLPSLSLSFGLGRSEVQGSEGDFFIFDPRNRSTYVSLQARWSLFDGFRRQAENARASAERDAARYGLAKAMRQQQAAVRSAHRDLQAAYRRFDLARQTLDLARERVRLGRERYRLGSPEMTYWALQEVLRQATEAEREAVAARYDFFRGLADLEAAVGGGVETAM